MILGLVGTEQYTNERFKNIRRSVQYFMPNGAAPLTGILSLADDETTNDPEYTHWEQRLAEQKTLTVANGGYGGSGAGPFTTTVPGDLTATFTWTKDASKRVYIADVTQFRIGHLVKIVATIGGIDKDLRGIVEAVSLTTATPNYMVVRSVETVASVVNAVTDIGDEVLVTGTAFGQGIVNISTEVYDTPIRLENYTQIWRTPFSITGTALKTPLLYDESGPFKSKARQHSIQHMIEIEQTLLWGAKSVYVPGGSGGLTPTSATTGAGLPVYTTGGIEWYLRQWEMAASPYRGATSTAVTADTDDNKRIIENTAGTITEKAYDGYLERVFRVTNNLSNEKLVLCGSGFLQTMNQMYRSKTVLNSDLPLTSTYGMNVVRHTCPFGTVYYKTHPLFSRNSILRYAALFLDVKNIKYKPMAGRDTELLADRAPNNADYKEWEYLTEAGFEMWFPESCMFMKNVRDYTL